MNLKNSEIVLLREHVGLLLHLFDLASRSIEQSKSGDLKVGYVNSEASPKTDKLEKYGIVKTMKDGKVKIYPMFRGKKEPLSPETEKLYMEYLEKLKPILKKARGFQSGCDKSRTQFAAAMKQYTFKDLIVVATRAAATPYHIESGRKYLTPEFLTRKDKIIMYLNSNPILSHNPFTHPGR